MRFTEILMPKLSSPAATGDLGSHCNQHLPPPGGNGELTVAIPRCSMYGVYLPTLKPQKWHSFVGKYTIDGASGR